MCLGFLSTGAIGAPKQDLVVVSHLTGPLYVVEDNYRFRENSVFYVGASTVTLIGTEWTPEIAALINAGIKKITSKPVREVLDTDYNCERAGGNAYWRSVDAEVTSTTMRAKLLRCDWTRVGDFTRTAFPDYRTCRLACLQRGGIRAFYLGRVAHARRHLRLFADAKTSLRREHPEGIRR